MGGGLTMYEDLENIRHTEENRSRSLLIRPYLHRFWRDLETTLAITSGECFLIACAFSYPVISASGGYSSIAGIMPNETYLGLSVTFAVASGVAKVGRERFHI